jgi:hypothetical protein
MAQAVQEDLSIQQQRPPVEVEQEMVAPQMLPQVHLQSIEAVVVQVAAMAARLEIPMAHMAQPEL